MGSPQPLGPRLRDLLRDRLRMLLTLAPKERPDLLVVVIVIAVLVLGGYALAFFLGA
jgi:hypothetical protein